MAHELIAGLGYRLMSHPRWITVVVKLRSRRKVSLFAASPILVREIKSKIVPMSGNFMAKMDKVYGSILNLGMANIYSRRLGFATAVVRSGLHFAAMGNSQGVTLQHVELSVANEAAITTLPAIDAYKEPRDQITLGKILVPFSSGLIYLF